MQRCSSSSVESMLNDTRRLEELHIVRKIAETRALKLPVVAEEGFDTVQRISEREVPLLTDLMETTVEEIAAYENAVLQQERKIRDLQEELGGRYRFADIIGKSERMRRLY